MLKFLWSTIKKNKYTTIYDICNVQKAAKFNKRIELENISEAYSITNTKKFDISNETQKHMLYKQFVACNCNDCSIVPLTDYIHNHVFQELPDENKYFGNGSDERIYIDLRDSYDYTSEMEKPTRNDSKMIIKVGLKTCWSEKWDSGGIQMVTIFTYC